MVEDQQRKQHRLWTLAITAAFLSVVAIVIFVVPVFARDLNAHFVLGIPAGFYMAAQGAFIIFAILVFWAAGRQEMLDRKLGASDDN